MALPSTSETATKQRFQFKSPEPGWEAQYVDRAEQGTPLDTIRANMKQALEQNLLVQLNDEVRSDQLSPNQYQKYRKFVSEAAMLFCEKFTLHNFVLRYVGLVPSSGPVDELFDAIGCRWVAIEQFEEALAAFETCVEVSKREGCWWPQKLCARYNHLAFAHMVMGNQPEQLRASMRGAAFAVATRNSTPDSTTYLGPDVFDLSFLNLAAQFVGFNPDWTTAERFVKDTIVQEWEKIVAERRRTHEEKLDSGKQEVTSEADLWFAFANFLIHNDQDSFKPTLEILKCSLSGRLSASELKGHCDLATEEFKFLMKVCQLDSLNMTLDAQQAEKLRTNLSFVSDLLEVASTIDPLSEQQCKGWLVSLRPMVSLYTDERGIPCYPGICFLLFIKQDSTPSNFVSNRDLAVRDAGGIATPVVAEGSNYEEFVAIQKRGLKTFNLANPSDFQEYADLGRDLGLWATSPSTVAVAPVHNIKIALNTLLALADTVRQFPLHPHAAKLMLQDVVSRLTDQFNSEVKDLSMKILLQFAQICADFGDVEERVNICMKGLELAEEHNMDKCKWGFHYFLGITYIQLGEIFQAEKELRSARQIMNQNQDLNEVIELKANIEGVEGCLEMLKCHNARNKVQASEHSEEALRKLTSSFQEIEKLQTSEERYSEKSNFITLSLMICEGLQVQCKYAEAQEICSRAFYAAKKLKSTVELKFSKKLKILTTRVASTCGYQAQLMGFFASAEDFYREGLKELQELHNHGYVDDEFMAGMLYSGLGRTLLRQEKLTEAEDILKKAVKACSQFIMGKTLTSQARIAAFDLLQHCYNDLQLCLFGPTSTEASECQHGVKSMEALVAAERGRCRDLTLNLEEVLKSRITNNENVSGDYEMDWEKFDTDTNYAWGHLRNCMARCTDAVKEQNPEVQRVAFVEYTLTNGHMLIWVLHSHGTQEPSTSEETALPFMYAVEVREKFEEELSNYRTLYEKNVKWIYRPPTWDSHLNHMLQNAEANEAVFLFETQIEKLRGTDDPDIRKLNQLYDLLISPIASKLAIGEPVIFIPHEGLSFVPFAALKPRKSRKHFIEDHPIGYASSLRTLGWATNQYTALKANIRISSENPLLLVADPALEPEDEKDALTDARDEVKKIATMPQIPANSTVTLEGEQATLKHVTSTMKTSSWCHIACHGEVHPELYPQGVLFLSRSNDSSLEVSEASPSDPEFKLHRQLGRLTPQILTKDVRCMMAQAAVLSACKVAQGKKTGEGLLGLARAFMQAGVPSVIAPLRTVDSGLCSAFMQSFYTKMLAGQSVMFALRNTMVDVIKKRIEVPDKEDEGNMIKWQLWDWAAWVAVGFPGVCLPLPDPFESQGVS